MNYSVCMYIFVMAAVTYLIRMLPLVLFKKEIADSVFEIFFVLRSICLPGSYDIPGNPDGAVFRNGCGGNWTDCRTDRCI